MELTDARLKLQNDLRTTALQAIAGLAVLAGAVLAFQQLTTDRQQANRLAVTEVLVAFLHRRGARPANPTTQPAEKLRVRAPEVQAALTVLIRRAPPPADPPLNLNLRGFFRELSP